MLCSVTYVLPSSLSLTTIFPPHSPQMRLVGIPYLRWLRQFHQLNAAGANPGGRSAMYHLHSGVITYSAASILAITALALSKPSVTPALNS